MHPHRMEVPGRSAQGWEGTTIYTIGHSTHELDDFLDWLEAFDVLTLADVRSQPGSRRLPQFNAESLAQALHEEKIAYVHFPLLGGRRHTRKDSPNQGWHNVSFRGYADYMGTPEFEAGLERLRLFAQAGPIALMCAEAVPWRCHRSLIADALVARGVPVLHIESATRAVPHELTSFAVVRNSRVSYPAPSDRQGSLPFMPPSR